MNGWFGDGNGYKGHMDLNAETANTVSFTADFHDPKNNSWEFRATPYFTYVDDFIDADRCSGSAVNGAANGCDNLNLTARNRYVFLDYANHDARLYGVSMFWAEAIYTATKPSVTFLHSRS